VFQKGDINFQNSFTSRVTSKMMIPLHCKCVVTLPCKIFIWENKQQSQADVVINDKSQGNVATFRCDRFHYKFSAESASEFFFNCEYLAKLQARRRIVSHT